MPAAGGLSATCGLIGTRSRVLVGNVSIGAAVFEIVAEYVLPTLVAEVGSYTVRQAARRVSGSCVAPRPSTRPAPRVHAMDTPLVLSDTPGRLRVKVPGLQGAAPRARTIAMVLTRLRGVERVGASALTGTVLVEYDGAQVGVAAIRAALLPRRAAHQSRLQPPSESGHALVVTH
jgi:copper chaperone CopZ